MIPDKQAVLVDMLGILQRAMHFRIKIFHHFVLGEIARHDRSALEAQLIQFRHQCFACELAAGTDHQAEAEPAAFTDLLLDDDVRMISPMPPAATCRSCGALPPSWAGV